jgi:rhodanese-related sulfurtransferase
MKMNKNKLIFQPKNQNKVFLLGFILILAVIGWSLARPIIFKNSQKEKEDAKINEEILKAPMITMKEFSEMTSGNEKIFIVDLRSADEFSRGHIAGAVNLPSGTEIERQLGALGAEKTASIIVLNEGDDVIETAKATNNLLSAGFINAKYLRGGISDWQSEGHTLVSEGKSPGDESKIKKITVEKIASDLAGGDELVQFVDVRGKEKFDSGHIPRAVNLPLSFLESDQKAISPAKKVIVYGENEEDANRAAVILFDLNFFNIFVLDGGLDAWKKADGKLE